MACLNKDEMVVNKSRMAFNLGEKKAGEPTTKSLYLLQGHLQTRMSFPGSSSQNTVQFPAQALT